MAPSCSPVSARQLTRTSVSAASAAARSRSRSPSAVMRRLRSDLARSIRASSAARSPAAVRSRASVSSRSPIRFEAVLRSVASVLFEIRDPVGELGPLLVEARLLGVVAGLDAQIHAPAQDREQRPGGRARPATCAAAREIVACPKSQTRWLVDLLPTCSYHARRSLTSVPGPLTATALSDRRPRSRRLGRSGQAQTRGSTRWRRQPRAAARRAAPRSPGGPGSARARPALADACLGAGRRPFRGGGRGPDQGGGRSAGRPGRSRSHRAGSGRSRAQGRRPARQPAEPRRSRGRRSRPAPTSTS